MYGMWCVLWGLTFSAVSQADQLPDASAIARQIDEAWVRVPALYVRYDVIIEPSVEQATSKSGAVLYRGPYGTEHIFAFRGLARYSLVSDASSDHGGTRSERAFDGETYYQRVLPLTDAPPEQRSGSKPVARFLTRTTSNRVEDYGFYFECVACPDYNGRGLYTKQHAGAFADGAGLAKEKIVERPYGLVSALKQPTYRVVGRAKVGQSDCIEVQGPGDRLWLDESLNFALRRRQWNWSADHSLQYELRLDQFQKISDGVWLPWTVEQSRFAAPIPDKPCPVTPLLSVKLRVTEMKNGPLPDDLFRLGADAGVTVADHTLLKDSYGDDVPVLYTAGRTPAETEAALNQALEFNRQLVGKEARSRWWVWTTCIIAFVVVLVSLIRFLRRRANTV